MNRWYGYGNQQHFHCTYGYVSSVQSDLVEKKKKKKDLNLSTQIPTNVAPHFLFFKLENSQIVSDAECQQLYSFTVPLRSST